MEEALRVAVDEGEFQQAKELCQKVSELKAKLAALGGSENSTPSQRSKFQNFKSSFLWEFSKAFGSEKVIYSEIGNTVPILDLAGNENPN